MTQTAAAPAKRNLAGAGLGALAGGLLGHTVGGGNGKAAATAVGAVAGAFIGDDVANRGATAQVSGAPVEVQDCTTVKETQNRLIGYRVQYSYGGHDFESVVRDNPGKTLAVVVSVLPVEGQP